MSNKVVIDAGFGGIKAIAPNGYRFKYPAKYARFERPKYISDLNITEYLNNMVMEWMGEKYFVGNSANIHGTPIQTVTKNRMVSLEGKLHIMAALGYAMDEGKSETDLIVGLPVDEYNELKDQYLQIISGQHEITMLNFNETVRKNVNVKINRSKVLPQPMGAAYRQLVNPDGSLVDVKLTNSIIGVIDLGYRTEDLCQLNQLQFMSKHSKSNPKLGCYSLFVALAEMLRQKGILDKEPEYYESCFNQDSLLIGGESIPIGEYKRQAFEMILMAILSDIQTTWPNIREAAMVIIGGGGAYIFGESIKKSLIATYRMKEEVFVIPPGSEFLNVEGYRRHADRIWRG
jgi:plasmid segregation protein ParM